MSFLLLEPDDADPVLVSGVGLRSSGYGAR